jgi:phage-related protein
MSTTPYLILTDSAGTPYNFPLSLFISADPVSTRSSIKDFLYAHGGKQIGDGFISSRQLTIDGVLMADDKSTFDMAYRSLIEACLKGGKLSVSDDATKFIQVGTPHFDTKWDHYPNAKAITIMFDCVFPFWQDTSITTSTHVLAGNGTFTVDTTGTDSLIMPVIEIDSDQGVDVPTIKLQNLTDNGLSIEYDNLNFLSGNILVLDSSQGTATLNNSPAMDSFVSGAFIRLQPGVNSFVYTGAACTIKVMYRKLYL